ncbi:MAG: hypothetical protein Q9190_000871 [Brigantiaea leucoxantha]
MPITYVNGFPMLSADMNADWPLVPPPNSHVDSLEIFTDSHRQEMKVEVFYQREGFQLPLPQDVDDCPELGHWRTKARRVSPGVVVKFGGGVDLKEAKTMLFIAERTSIPIPKLLAAYTYGPLPGTKEAPRYRTYIFTEYVPGAIFDNVWDESSDAFKAKVKGELKGYMEELRAIPAPPDYVGPVQNEAIQLYEWRWHSFKHSPVKSLDDFHKLLVDEYVKEVYLGNTIGEQEAIRERERIREQTFAQLNAQEHSIVFGHNNLDPNNVIVSPEGHVQAIISWGRAGWFPDYLDYVRASRWGGWWNPHVKPFLDGLMEPLPRDLLELITDLLGTYPFLITQEKLFPG